jgi:hypothetical protein
MEFKTGKVVWSNRGAGKGVSLRMACLHPERKRAGTVALVERPAKENGRFNQPDRSNKIVGRIPSSPTASSPCATRRSLLQREEGLTPSGTNEAIRTSPFVVPHSAFRVELCTCGNEALRRNDSRPRHSCSVERINSVSEFSGTRENRWRR